ncbi:MAG: CoB--CoM heterodisulfide reductase iron-sulfur subunit A family protein [Candidatus Eisenbacteria bacterium]
MKRIGVFVCWCGSNIAETVDIEQLTEAMMDYPGVVSVVDYSYMCSDPGQNLIRETIIDKDLGGVVIACCSPTLHEATFRDLSRLTGLNPYQCEIANIREQCSWVHRDDKQAATAKAIRIIRTVVEKALQNESLEPIKTPIVRRALVIGGGIAGIQASLDIANAGYDVVLVERNPSIGGHMIQLSETFPTLDCSQCILTPKMVQVARHPRITLLAYADIQDVSGYVGNFNVRILKRPRYVIESKCNLCGKCADVCPIAVPAEFERGLTARKAIYLPFPQAIPATYTIDARQCPGFLPIACGKCAQVCEPGAIDFDMKPEVIEETFGAIVVATGYDTYPKERIREFGRCKYDDVMDGLQFERLLSATGPTQGEIRRLSDGKTPKRVVFLSCVGSRNREHHLPYCSKVCCMYTAKHAMLYKHKVPDGEAIVFYIDIRAGGKGYEEFVERAQLEDKVLYIRGKVSRVFSNGNGKMVVWGADTLVGKQIEIECDMVVLSTAMVPSAGAQSLISKLNIASDEYGFISEAHPKLRPVESVSAGFFLAGAAQAPRDIPETVAHASGAASKVADLFAEEELKREPIVAVVNESLCSGCGACLALCPYQAREFEIRNDRRIAAVNESLCEGCGSCISACPSGACQQRNLTDDQILKMVEAALS